MAESSGERPDKRAFRVRTLGSLALLDDSGVALIAEHGQQRRRLGFLAVLAAAGTKGRTRDQLLLLFWPDAPQSRARHSLEQLVYALRNSLHENVFAGANPLRLNPDVIGSDVEEFGRALERGDPLTAVRLYGGPFLDGFYLSEAPEFEQWMHAERNRLARSYASALEQLAVGASEAGDHTAAIHWWRQLADTDPVSSQAAVGLMRALVSAGDHGAALRHAEEYEMTVGRELGTGAGPAVKSLVAELRAGAESRSIPAPAGETPTPRSPPREPPSKRTESRTPAVEVETTGAMTAAVRTQSPRRRSAVVGLGALTLLATSALVARQLVVEERGSELRAVPTNAQSIAVLPLAALGETSEDASLADGLTEELIGVLARVPGLRVVARTSAFVFKDSGLDVRRIADSLHVMNVLEGSVQKHGQQLRVQLRLVDARDGTTRWSQAFDRNLRDIFVLQSEIAAQVANELNLRLTVETRQDIRGGPTRSVAAYELYLKGRDPVNFRSDSGPLLGLEYLRQAVALDSGFAAAYANMAYMGYVLISRDSTYREVVRQSARRALELDPRLAESHAAAGMAHLTNGDLQSAAAAFERSVDLPGYTRAREQLANVYLWLGRPADALAQNVAALERDPLSPTATADLGRSLCLNGRIDEGLAQLARVANLQPPLRRVPFFVQLCDLMNGNWQRVANDATGAWPEYRGYALARSGRARDARAIRAALIERWRRTGTGAFEVAIVSAGLADHDAAFLWLERSLKDQSFRWEIMYPYFADLHADERFRRIQSAVPGAMAVSIPRNTPPSPMPIAPARPMAGALPPR